MVCIYCGEKTSVINSRSSTKTLSTWRRRICSRCQGVFTTREQIELELVLRVQKAGHLQPFQRDKLFLSVYRSLSHRKTPTKDAGALTSTVIHHLLAQPLNGLLQKDDIIARTKNVLLRFDKVAATHYIAHHPG